MTAPLRRAHFRIWKTVAIVLAGLIAAALANRHDTMPPNPVRWESLR